MTGNHGDLVATHLLLLKAVPVWKHLHRFWPKNRRGETEGYRIASFEVGSSCHTEIRNGIFTAEPATDAACNNTGTLCVGTDGLLSTV